MTGVQTCALPIFAQYLLDLGFSRAATAGILGNIQCESGFKPDSDFRANNAYESNKNMVAGLFQFTNVHDVKTGKLLYPNYDNFKKWIKENNRDISDWRTSLDYIFDKNGNYFWEARFRGALSANQYKNSTDPEQAAVDWARWFEGSTHNKAGRQRAARRFYNLLGQQPEASSGDRKSVV